MVGSVKKSVPAKSGATAGQHGKPTKAPRIIIPKRTKGSVLRVGALAWSQYELDSQRWLSEQDVAESIRLVVQEIRSAGGKGINADIILCSGAAVWTERDVSDKGVAASFMKASGGVPVLNEWKDESGDPAEWWLAYGATWKQVRVDQHFSKSHQAASKGGALLQELAAGWGHITVKGGKGSPDAELMLILCNEARILQTSTAAGLFANVKKKQKTLPTVFSKPWFVLHPSHRPYLNTRERGAGLVAPWFKAPRAKQTAKPSKPKLQPPIFEVATVPKKYGAQQAPRAVIHAGPYKPTVTSDRNVATCAFDKGMRIKPALPKAVVITVAGLVEIQYSEFEFKL